MSSVCEKFRDLHIFVVRLILTSGNCWKGAHQVLQENISGENQDDINKKSYNTVSELVNCMMYPVPMQALHSGF